MQKRKIVAIIQARMGSTRLPGKTLADIAGKPLLQHVIERCQASKTIAEVVVATTRQPSDHAITALCVRLGVAFHRGSADDVLDRYYHAALQAQADIVVRVTADDPFKDPRVVDDVIAQFLADNETDYASNSIVPTYPEGLDVEVFTFAALRRAWQEARLCSEREHVTPYMWKNPDRFRIVNVANDRDLSHLRWTIDYEEDLRFAREVYARLGNRGIFLMHDILALLASEPGIGNLNRHFTRNQGYLKSLQEDRITK